MAKKKKEDDSEKHSGFWGGIKSAIAGEISGGIVGTIKKGAKEALDRVEERVHMIVHETLKKLTLFFLMITGMIFVLVGFSKYISETVRAFDHGLGFLVVGVVIILLGVFASWMSK